MYVKNPEYFLTIVKERSISKAAERLYLSQPYLSQYLAKLEGRWAPCCWTALTPR